MSDNNNFTFNCSICKLEKIYHEDLFETSILTICDECNVEGIFQENCSKCDREFSETELEFLIKKFNKVFNCVQCLAGDKDKKLELSFFNFKYLNRVVKPIMKDEFIKYKYDELTKNVNKLMKISNKLNICGVIQEFERLKDINRQINTIINAKNLKSIDDINRIIENNSKYKKELHFHYKIFNEMKMETIDEVKDFYDKVSRFLRSYNFKNISDLDYFVYKNMNKDIFLNNKNEIDENIKNDPPKENVDEFFIEYKHKLKDYKLKKLLLKNKEYKDCKKINSKDKNININELNSLHINITESYINILDDLDLLEKEAKEIEKVLPIFDKLKNNINIVDKYIVEDNELSKLFSKLNNDKINEYNTMNQIGKNIIENNLDDDYINKYIQTFNDRKGRIILKCKRIYLLSKHINIEAIALSGISHFIRDSHINTFNCLLDLLKTYISVDLIL